MIKHTNRQTGQLEVMNSRQIKAEIKELTGWTEEEYNKEYFKYRNRIRNFETITGAETAARPNEELLRTVRRAATGRELTAEQSAILQTTAARVGEIRRAVEENRLSRTQNLLALQGIESIFHNMIEKSKTTNVNGETIKEAYQNWLNEVVGQEILKDKRGQPILDENGQAITVDILRNARVSPQEVQKFLAAQARDLHRRQQMEYNSNKEYYRDNNKRPGS